MKIIVQGQDPATLPFNLACQKCSTVVELLGSELQTAVDSAGNGISYIKCPVCQADIDSCAANQQLAKDILDKQAAVKKQLAQEMREAQEEKERQRLKAEREFENSDEYDRYYSRDSDRYKGGPTGPLPPPELPVLPCVTKIAKMAIK